MVAQTALNAAPASPWRNFGGNYQPSTSRGLLIHFLICHNRRLAGPLGSQPCSQRWSFTLHPNLLDRHWPSSPSRTSLVDLEILTLIGDNYKMDISRIIVIKWIIVVVGSFVGGFIAGFVPATMVSRLTPGSYAGGITLLVGWFVGGIFIWMGLIKLMNLRAFPL